MFDISNVLNFSFGVTMVDVVVRCIFATDGYYCNLDGDIKVLLWSEVVIAPTKQRCTKLFQ